MKLMARVTSAFDHLINFLAYLGMALVVFACFSVVLEVFMRRFLGRPQIWVNEIIEYILLTITFLGAAWLLREGGHVVVDVVLNYLSPRRKAFLNAFTSVLGAVVCLVIVWRSGLVTWNLFLAGSYDPMSMLHLPEAPLLAPIPIGSFLFFIQFLRRTNGYLKLWRTGGMGKQQVEEAT